MPSPLRASIQAATPAPTPARNLPVTTTFAGATALFGMSRSRLYVLAGQNKIRTLKEGRRTLLLVDSLVEHINALAPADIRVGSVR